MNNDLLDFFERRQKGRGIWKWNHYFDIYERHFHRFRGRDVRILEIGVYSGGSLEMWRDYFGPESHIYGVDIEPSCKVYENDHTTIKIGDQADRSFWRRFLQEIPEIDIVIDDGGHTPEQQRVTLEELLPRLRPGGVYLCEDIHGDANAFASYIHAMAHELNAATGVSSNLQEPERRLSYRTTPFQAAVRSICLYPYVAVIERNDAPVGEFVAPKRGTQWQPFLE